MYRDLNTVEIDPIINDKCAVKKYKMYKNILRVGFENIKGNNWEKSFYDQLNINYKHRFNSFFIDRDTERENNLILAKNTHLCVLLIVHLITISFPIQIYL